MNFEERYKYNVAADLVGKGGFSRVFKAHDTLLHRDVALKVYSVSASEKYDLVSEIRKVIGFDHPNLCRYYDVTFLEGKTPMGEVEKYQVGIMEFMDGGDIRSYIRKNPQFLNKLLKDVLQGLSYLHKKGIIHRDLKPQNILIKVEDGIPIAKITDFGISKAMDSDQHSSSALLGTIEYMAPEQFNPERYGVEGKISTNLDLWSFGVMMFDLITGNTLFGSRTSGISAEQVMSNILNESSIADVKNLAPNYRNILEVCLQKDAKNRVQTADILISMLASSAAINENSDDESTLVLPKTFLDSNKVKEDLIDSKLNTEYIGTVKTYEKKKPNKKKKILIPIVIVIAVLAVLSFVFKKQLFSSFGRGTVGNIKDTLAADTGFVAKLEKTMVKIPGGTFLMGCDGEDCNFNEQPAHDVSISEFRMCKFEVTQAQWTEIMGSNPSNNSDCPSCPVENISQKVVVEFIERVNKLSKIKYRLPTEAEWEYVASYSYSIDNTTTKVAWVSENSDEKTHNVGIKQPNALGIYDMQGNVWELCSDWYDDEYYKNSEMNNPKGPNSGNIKVLRGGSYLYDRTVASVRLRAATNGKTGSTDQGFRLVRDEQ